MNAAEAKKRANAFLREDGSHLVAKSARKAGGAPEGRRVWVVAYVDPAEPDAMLTGGALAVTEDGKVHTIGSAPGDPALQNLLFSSGNDATEESQVHKEHGD
ncbi:hypothetical protein [Nocardioides cavernaquae]|uniref:Uncharacterized protein n=1 Tax=Nocardioides cavernaquae TaxID=2321396 RepID=A0A3A5H706_9ACTN|nr:hypothetical protein [Nocardioides cavernaquae]RJS46459.1 hypothetical protein D4739_09715 [Nocardioides cavernaquae]